MILADPFIKFVYSKTIKEKSISWEYYRFKILTQSELCKANVYVSLHICKVWGSEVNLLLKSKTMITRKYIRKYKE